VNVQLVVRILTIIGTALLIAGSCFSAASWWIIVSHIVYGAGLFSIMLFPKWYGFDLVNLKELKNFENRLK
jgi:hypothetical protein